MEAAYFHESLEEVRADLEQLLKRHWQEVAFYKDIPPEPDWDTYATAERIGRLRIFTARVRTELIGCCVFLVGPNLHYKGSLQAGQDVLFFAPSYRDGPIPAHLILFADRELRDEGVQVIYHKISPHLDMGPLLERLGYEVMDTVWGKRLDSLRDKSGP